MAVMQRQLKKEILLLKNEKQTPNTSLQVVQFCGEMGGDI